VFTRLPDAALAELARVFDLGVVASCTPIAAGTINSNFAVDTARGRWFLRVNEGKTEADVAWEAQLVTALAAAGVPTPAPVPAGDRLYAPLGDKWVSVFPWRPGHHLTAVDATDAHTLGAALTAAREVRARATHGIIHGDLFRDNVLWEAGRLVAILDFEQASSGSFAYDLAVCLNDWCWSGAPRPELAHALLAGYASIRPLTDADREALPIEVRAAAARFTITRITDVYLAKVDNPEKDFRAFLTRCEAWRGQALGQLAAAL